MSIEIEYKYLCLLCKKPVPDYRPLFCCDGRECACLGLPINPAVCSTECFNAVMNGIGKSFEQRRIDAGIGLFKKPDHDKKPAPTVTYELETNKRYQIENGVLKITTIEQYPLSGECGTWPNEILDLPEI